MTKKERRAAARILLAAKRFWMAAPQSVEEADFLVEMIEGLKILDDENGDGHATGEPGDQAQH